MEVVQPAENNGKSEAWLDTLYESYINQFQFDSSKLGFLYYQGA